MRRKQSGRHWHNGVLLRKSIFSPRLKGEMDFHYNDKKDLTDSGYSAFQKRNPVQDKKSVYF